jgi:hypothetical protein
VTHALLCMDSIDLHLLLLYSRPHTFPAHCPRLSHHNDGLHYYHSSSRSSAACLCELIILQPSPASSDQFCNGMVPFPCLHIPSHLPPSAQSVVTSLADDKFPIPRLTSCSALVLCDKKKKQSILPIPKRASATSLRGRTNKGTGSGGGTRKHRTWNRNLIVTITQNQSRTGRNRKFIITVCK